MVVGGPVSVPPPPPRNINQDATPEEPCATAKKCCFADLQLTGHSAPSKEQTLLQEGSFGGCVLEGFSKFLHPQWRWEPEHQVARQHPL